MKNKVILLLQFSLILIVLSATQSVSAQVYGNPQGYGNYPVYNGNFQNPMANSNAFRQEIARVEIKVVRGSRPPLPIMQVPRLQKGDVLKVRLLDEAVNGMKPDQTNFEWTFLTAFLNPIRNNGEETASNEIQFKKTGWYIEYSFNVPYDSQPMFFLYTKPNYRTKILDLIKKNQDDLRKIGEKTIEIADAYAKIGSFLNEVQMIMSQNRYRYGNNSYYPNYGNYNNTFRSNQSSLNEQFFKEQLIERLAKGFNIELPSCWKNQNGYGNYSGYNNYGGYQNYGGYNNYPNYGGYGMSDDFMTRVQCVAQNIRLEDFDLSISRMLQQGGIMVASQLAQKYPQLAYWINIAGAAIDLILKITKRTPLRLVPTVISTNPNQGQFNAYQQQPNMYQNNFAQNNLKSFGQLELDTSLSKISVYAESSPRDTNFVTAYPLVTHKWQANPDPEVINLPIPTLTDSCLHTGQNILRNTDLTGNWMADVFTRDFKLIISASNGFRKEFPLKKNQGLSGWELNLTKEDLNSFPKIKIMLEAEIAGQRGFNEIRSPKFEVPVGISDGWEITSDSTQKFAVGERRSITLKNRLGSCGCLQAVVFKPAFGGQFIFEAGKEENGLLFSEDGKEVSFEVDTRDFKAGEGKLELRQSGGEVSTLNLTLYPAPPIIENVKISKGGNQAIITGERLDQVRAVKLNGKRAVLEDANSSTEWTYIFEDSQARQESAIVTVEMELENNRRYPVPKTFPASPPRPAIAADKNGEVQAIAMKTKSTVLTGTLPIFPIDTPEIALTVQNILTDYDFKQENIRIEVRFENANISPNDLPKVSYEVLDWKNMKISFYLNEELQKFVGGKRLQFRIRDKERGNSDWFTVRQTFVRTPKINSFQCTQKSCELKGTGIEYISQISTDGGKTWFPDSPATLIVQPTANGLQKLSVPSVLNKNLLRIKLRDFPKVDVGRLKF